MEKNINNYKLVSLVLYIIFGVVTAIGVSIMLAWAISGDIEREIDFIAATFVADETEWRQEYLVGQSIQTAGGYINIGTEEEPENISLSDCSVTADFTSAGEKSVEISYMYDDYTTYTAATTVSVIYVRNMYIQSYPELLTVNDDGTVTFDDVFAAYAVLSDQPQTDVFGTYEVTENGYRIKLTEDMYTISCVANSKLSNYYSLTLYCGDLSASFNVYNASAKSFVVSSVNDIVTYTNTNSSSSAQMMLVVTDRDDGYQIDCTGSTYGSYVYISEAGEEIIIPFSYSLTDTEEIFNSSTLTAGITESYETMAVESNSDEDVYAVSYGGQKFTATATVFQNAVVNGIILEDQGFKLVVDSENRVLTFTCDTEDDGTFTCMPALTLYVTDYEMNPLLGTGNGWSRGVYIYTDINGTAHKLTFYMQAWVWTYVPLSANYADVYDDITVTDYVYNEDAPADLQYNSYYRGTMYTVISQYVRGYDFITINFSVPDILDGEGNITTASEDQWLVAMMGI